jgi:hypothetical protein
MHPACWLGGAGSERKLVRALKPLVDAKTWPVVRPEFEAWARAPAARFGPAWFAEHFGTWRGNGKSENPLLDAGKRFLERGRA